MKLLHLDSSILGENSVSRKLSAYIVARLCSLHPGLEVVYRDLASQAPWHLSARHLVASQGAEVDDPALCGDFALGQACLDELLAADVLVIGAPMYNFSIPSSLKAWIDRVAVAGKTFAYTDQGPQGLLAKRKAYIASVRGGQYAEGMAEVALDHQERYLRDLLGFLGVTDVTVIRAEGVAMSDADKEQAIADASARIAALSLD
ncbi:MULTISPECIES: FMN-dependent NADH-azoreductase [unclassified Herbaspirillum]|uniref:FMN-dependent NADH-azoreductase n=1 Tax=unclassified Herbaspirillum TaxID=2624150 RepID=UPI00116D1C94|nr:MULTISPECIES: FMN-dependent NADH-azoreductase [unclassified Herbaspirillum]MBB5390197.1 FMN-dependent NADH-azoreductase [Herbaspirillum sp. SJZ102]TQK09304.1 FMN-dependent NADH-azoreductase [Herbaspirillum sp. SJZ130]TQK14009.1 FMN-dependent NADH-azoreductase [Herbaspirillum sp. SJZ106]